MRGSRHRLFVLVFSCVVGVLFLKVANASVIDNDAYCHNIDTSFNNVVESVLGSDRAQTRSGFFMGIINASTGEWVCSGAVQGTRNIYPASSIKTLVAMAVLKRIDLGDYTLQTQVTINQPNANRECGASCSRYANGRVRTIEEMIFDSITWSSNLATNQLIDLATKSFINQTAAAVGAPSLKVVRKVYNNINPEPEITARNESSALGYAELYREISTGRLGYLSEASRTHLVSVLAQQRHNNRLNDRFPNGVTFYHKTGTTSDSSSDAGFYYINDQYIVVLVGLQNFRSYSTLQRIGHQAFTLTADYF